MFSIRQEILITIGISLFVLLLTLFVVGFLFYHQRKRREYALQKETMQNAFQQELLRTQLEIQEQTLNHISQEIHDNFGQTLSLAKLHLNTVDPQRPELVPEKVASAKALVSKVIQDLRQLSKTLHGDAVLTAGLVSAVRQELDLIDRSGAFHTQLTIAGTPQKTDPQKELILFRIVQEALHNCLKHSGADTLTVGLGFTGSQLEVAVADNGGGFPATGSTDGSGLRNMRSRAALIGGQLALTTGATGTTVTITLPV
ncbi:MAG: sensor histidine kinase [Flaviaesturariibacter sp.]|nr:sensor histidine kinase [Flaviaesturariibacter sp.]